jgi:hypothetical protein
MMHLRAAIRQHCILDCVGATWPMVGWTALAAKE